MRFCGAPCFVPIVGSAADFASVFVARLWQACEFRPAFTTGQWILLATSSLLLSGKFCWGWRAWAAGEAKTKSERLVVTRFW